MSVHSNGWELAAAARPVAAVLILSATGASADTINIFIVSPAHGFLGVSVSGAQATKSITLIANLPDMNGKTVHMNITAGNATTSNTGTFGSGNIPADAIVSFNIQIKNSNTNTQIWNGLPTSLMSKDGLPVPVRAGMEPLGKANQYLEQFNGLPFMAADAAPFVSGTDIFNQFTLVNSDTTSSYLLTSLNIYQDLDLTNFNSSDFDSSAAIGSSTPVVSLTNQLLLQAGPDADPLLTFSIGPVTPFTYDLLTGTASQILPDGSLGSPVDFSFADAVVVPPNPQAICFLARSASRYLSAGGAEPGRRSGRWALNFC
jgi:hypothetical protein